MNTTENYRVFNFRNGEKPKHSFEEIKIQKDRENICVSRITFVMNSVTLQDDSLWPKDEYWQNNLPEWLLSTFKKYSAEELQKIMADKSNWDKVTWSLGSWIDRMKDRDWVWWSSRDDKDFFTIVVQIDGEPTSLGALQHLIKASGGEIVE